MPVDRVGEKRQVRARVLERMRDPRYAAMVKRQGEERQGPGVRLADPAVRTQLVGRPAMPLRVPMDGPWSASVLLVEREGTIVIGGLVVAPSYRRGRVMEVAPSGLTVRELRSIRLSDAFRDTYALYLGFPGAVSRDPTEDELMVMGPVPGGPAPPGLIRTGRTKTPPQRGEHLAEDDYAEIATLYLRALGEDPRQPLKWIVEHYRKQGHRVSRDNLRDRVHRARDRGFLTTGRAGSAGAHRTEKLLEWQRKRKRRR